MSTPENAEPDSPEALRAEIDETREQLGDTVEALAAKTDVKARAEDRIEGAKQDARAKADQVKAKVTSVTPESARQSGGQLVAKAKANPMPLAGAAALVLAFAIGRRSAGRRGD